MKHRLGGDRTTSVEAGRNMEIKIHRTQVLFVKQTGSKKVFILSLYVFKELENAPV